MNATLNLEVSGHFKMVAVRPDGSKRFLAEFDNLITNTGLNRIGNQSPGTNNLTGCCVGTGTTAPAFSNTNLTNQIAHTTNLMSITRNTVPASNYSFYRVTYRFAAGTATGNLTEVGMRGDTSPTGALFSRALILDGSGNPTSITVLAEEALDVTYELRLYHPTADVTGTVNLGGTNYNYTIRRALSESADFGYPELALTLARGGTNPGAYSGGLVAATGIPSGSLASSSAPVAATYTTGNYFRDFTVTFGLTSPTSNIGSVVMITSLGIYQIAFSPVVPKTSSNIFTLNVRFTWARRV